MTLWRSDHCRVTCRKGHHLHFCSALTHELRPSRRMCNSRALALETLKLWTWTAATLTFTWISKLPPPAPRPAKSRLLYIYILRSAFIGLGQCKDISELQYKMELFFAGTIIFYVERFPFIRDLALEVRPFRRKPFAERNYTQGTPPRHAKITNRFLGAKTALNSTLFFAAMMTRMT